MIRSGTDAIRIQQPLRNIADVVGSDLINSEFVEHRTVWELATQSAPGTHISRKFGIRKVAALWHQQELWLFLTNDVQHSCFRALKELLAKVTKLPLVRLRLGSDPYDFKMILKQQIRGVLAAIPIHVRRSIR